MKGKININGVRGAKIGNIHVFTYEHAIEVFKMFLNHCYQNLTVNSAAVIDDVTTDMLKIGFNYDELEKIEIDFLKTM